MTSMQSFGEGSTGTQACGTRTRRSSQRRPVPVLGDTCSRRNESRSSTRSTEGTPRRAGTRPTLLDHPKAARPRRSFRSHRGGSTRALRTATTVAHSPTPLARPASEEASTGAQRLSARTFWDSAVEMYRSHPSEDGCVRTSASVSRARHTGIAEPDRGPVPLCRSEFPRRASVLTTCSVQSDNAADAVRTQRIRPRPTGIDAPRERGTKSPRRESDDTFQRFGAFRRNQRGDR
jgi:hypothetical protein